MNKFNENSNIGKIAYDLIDKDFSHSEIFEILKSGNDLEKQAVLINLEKINTQDEFEIFISNLVGQGGPIRENVSLKLAQMPMDFKIDNHLIINALCDVNPNVCRNIVIFLQKYKNEEFRELLIQRIQEILDDILKNYTTDNAKKSHILNKKVFHLYWCLEGLFVVVDTKIDNKIEEILKICGDFWDYTIREKTAQILTKIENPPIELLQKLKNDNNFYVKKQIYGKI